MEYYFILASIGLAMGVFGGLLGIGGSAVMIPALVWAFGENQHLYQASAMICNFFVCVCAVIVHKKQKALVPDVLKFLIPGAVAGVIFGVMLSNSSIFAGQNSFLLARIFGIFLIYVAIYNALKFTSHDGGSDGMDTSLLRKSPLLTTLGGMLTGLSAGLLGIGGGTVCTPSQQLFLKMPLKRAISNSAATIIALAATGAFYKNWTLVKHDIAISESLKIAGIVIPTAIVGSLIGTRLMHYLPKNVVRAAFIALALLASYKLLTVQPGV